MKAGRTESMITMKQEEIGLIFISSDKINYQVVSIMPMKPKRKAQMFFNCRSRPCCLQRLHGSPKIAMRRMLGGGCLA